MSWMLLLQSEFRRVRKAVVSLGSTHPIVLAAIPAVAVCAVVLAVRAGEAFFIIAFIPGGLSGFTIFLLIVGAVCGYAVSLMLPRETYFDEQFRSIPIRKIDLLMGLRALPLVLMTGLATILVMAMLWRIYAIVGVPATAFWVGIAGILFMSVSIQGASLSEAVRGHASWGFFSLATLAVASTPVVVLMLSAVIDSPWRWLATYLPQASLRLGEFSLALPPVHVAAIGAGISMLLSAFAWIGYSLRADRPPRQRRLHLTVPMGKGAVTTCLSWAILTTLRQSDSRNFLILTVTIGIGAVVLLSSWPVRGTDTLMLLLTSNLVLYSTALAVLTLSEDREAASWLVKTIPVSRRTVALAWCIPTCLLVFTVGTVSSLPAVIGFGRGITVWLLIVLLVAYACCTPVIGRLLPWNRRSPSRQLLISVALMVGAGATFYLFDWLGTLAAPIFGSTVLFVPVGGFLLLIGAGALSTAIEWADS